MGHFSKDSYSNIIKLVQREGFQFLSFQEEHHQKQRTVYLRHDVDYSLSMAVELARINASLGVRGTFFVLLRSQIYNLLSHWALAQVREILASGQRVALHCALPPTAPKSQEILDDIVLTDFAVVKEQIPEMEPVYSWHNPTREVLDISESIELPGFVNVYHQRFVKQARYLSDSNLRYTVPEWERLLIEAEQSVLHLLFHPLNWVAGGNDMCDVLAKTWRHIIKEREYEIVRNTTYQRLMPGGMPESVLEEFSRSWINATLQEKSQAS